MASDLFGARASLPGMPDVFRINRLDETGAADTQRLPHTVRILLEGLLRNAGGLHVREEDVLALARWPEAPGAGMRVPFFPARVLLQDFTGVPAVVDLAAMRAAMARAGRDPARVDPLVPCDLVIDHSVQVDQAGSLQAYAHNIEREYERNGERYLLLRWAQGAFGSFRVVPPGMGIVHQVNLEHLGRVVAIRDGVAVPDTLVGTDSHTTMINGLGVLGFGVGGIEAEAVMLGEPLELGTPSVVGVRMSGSLREGVTATDLVLTLTELLRPPRRRRALRRVLRRRPLGALAGRPRDALQHVARVRARRPRSSRSTTRCCATCARPAAASCVPLVDAHQQGAGPVPARRRPDARLQLRSSSSTSTASRPASPGPRRPQDRVPLADVPASFTRRLPAARGAPTAKLGARRQRRDRRDHVLHEHLEPVRDGRRGPARAQRRRARPAAPPARQDEPRARLARRHRLPRGGRSPGAARRARLPARRLRLHDLHRQLGPALGRDLAGRAGRRAGGLRGALGQPQLRGPHPPARARQLPRLPPARRRLRARRLDLGRPRARAARHRRRTAPTSTCATSGRPAREVQRGGRGAASRPSCSSASTRRSGTATSAGARCRRPRARSSPGMPDSTYVREPSFFQDLQPEPEPLTRRRGRALPGRARRLGHDRPHLARRARSRATCRPAATCVEHGVEPRDFNSFGARRGNHEVMVRGTFGNIRLRNALADGREGGYTAHLPSGDALTIFEAAERYRGRGRAAGGARRQGVRLRLARATGPRRARSCSASAPSSPRATSASTAPTSSAWACCRWSTSTARRRPRSASTGASASRSAASPAASRRTSG